MNPAGLLPNGRAQLIGKIGPRGDQSPVIIAQAQKGAAPSDAGEGQAQFVVLGQGIRCKGAKFALLLAPRGNLTQGCARYTAANSGGGQGCPKGGAKHHALGVAFGKLIRIMASDPV